MDIKEEYKFDLSIIIVSYNTRALIIKCIESIYKYTEDLVIEIIVSDNASSDNTAVTIENKYPNVYILQNGENLGFAAANNKALKLCRGRFILFLNPDITLNEPVFKKIIDFYEKNEDAGLVGCKLINPDGSFQKSFASDFPNLINRFMEAIYAEKLINKFCRFDQINNECRKVAALAGACILIKKDLIEKSGGFDVSFFMYCEDIDLSFRITRMGYKNYYLGNLKMLHNQGACVKKNKRSYFEKVLTKESVYKYFIKHRGRIAGEFYKLLMIISGLVRLIVLFSVIPVTRVFGI